MINWTEGRSTVVGYDSISYEQPCNANQPGYLTPADWIKFNAGGTVFGYTPISSNYTTQASDLIIGITSTASPITVTLIGAAIFGAGHFLDIKDESGGAASHNITVASSDLIDGVSSATISANYGCLKLYSNGTSWFTL